MRALNPLFLGLGGLLLAGCDEGGLDCSSSRAGCGENYAVRTNSVGYLPGRIKRATYRGDASSFRVLREDGSVAFEGQASEPVTAADSGETVRVADFTELEETGSFQIDVEGIGQSPPFAIAEDVFVEPMKTTMLGFYGQRCGEGVSFTHQDEDFSHGECHLQDAALTVEGGSEVRDVTKGWHDAGDYGKYTNNGAFSLGMMFMAWEHFTPALSALELPIPEAGGDTPDYLDECEFQLAWLFGMQLADGSVADRVSTRVFDAMTVRPEAAGAPRKLSPPSTVATADFAAVMAMAARIYEEYDADLAAQALEAAERAQAFLDQQAGELRPDLSQYTGGYQSGDQDDRLWALAELWETTGKEEYLTKFEAAAADASVRLNWDWPDLGNLGLFTYVLSEREGRDEALLEQLEQQVVNGADTMVEGASSHAYGRSIGDMYYWGINGVLIRTAMNLQVAERLTGDVRYVDAASAQIDHIFGRNYFGRSQVTGIGHGAPRQPHHRPSAADNTAWPGLLVGGPNGGEEDTRPPATRWNDKFDDYETNEVAINWNAALAYALASFLP